MSQHSCPLFEGIAFNETTYVTTIFYDNLTNLTLYHLRHSEKLFGQSNVVICTCDECHWTFQTTYVVGQTVVFEHANCFKIPFACNVLGVFVPVAKSSV